MFKRKNHLREGKGSFVLLAVVLLFIISLGVVYRYFATPFPNGPQFNPSTPGTLKGENKELGYSFLYPPYFSYKNNSGGVWTVVTNGVTNNTGSGTLTLIDKSQKPYQPYINMPQIGSAPADIYPGYLIQFTVLSNSADSGVFQALDKFQKEALSLNGRDVTVYNEHYNDQWGRQHYEQIVAVPANDYDYFAQYIVDQNPYRTGDKYLDVFHQIIQTMKFTSPTPQMINAANEPPPATPTVPQF